MPKSRSILVPVNGNVTDREALELAVRIAKPYKAKIYAIYVIEVKRALPLDAEIRPELDQSEELLDKAERLAQELGYDIETEILQAREVGPAIVDEAIARDVDLVIMGIVYKRRFGEFDLGRTAPYVLRNAPCRVWLTREPMQVAARTT